MSKYVKGFGGLAVAGVLIGAYFYQKDGSLNEANKAPLASATSASPSAGDTPVGKKTADLLQSLPAWAKSAPANTGANSAADVNVSGTSKAMGAADKEGTEDKEKNARLQEVFQKLQLQRQKPGGLSIQDNIAAMKEIRKINGGGQLNGVDLDKQIAELESFAAQSEKILALKQLHDDLDKKRASLSPAEIKGYNDKVEALRAELLADMPIEAVRVQPVKK